MNWNDPILFDFYSGNLPRYQQRPGTVNPDAIRAYMMGLPGRAPKQAPKSVPKGLTQIPAQDQFYQNQLQKYGRTREDIARSQQEAALSFLLATGAIGAAAAAPLLATAAPAIGAGLSYAPVASAPGATLGNLIAAAGVTDFALNRAPRIPGQIARGEYGEAALNTGLGVLDLAGANMINPIRQGASEASRFLTTQTPLKNAWKLNPRAYSQQADMMYRGVGQQGFEDAVQAGYLRSKQNVEPYYVGNFNLSKQFGKNVYFTPRLETAEQYGQGVVAAIPRSSARWASRYPRQGANSWSQFTQSEIPTEMVEFYKPHWWKRLAPIHNPVTPKTYPTIWSDLQGMTPTNVGEVLDLPGDLSNDVGLFNYGVFPTKKNPNILVKLENLNRYKELVDPNASIQSGLPELMRDITSPNISKSYMDIDLSNREFLKAIRPDINTVYNNPQIAGRVMSRVQGSPLDALLPSEMENIPTEAYQTFLDDIRMLSKKNIGLDLVGENIIYNPETKRFGMFDLAKLPTESGKSALSLNDLYGIGNTGNISNYRIQQYFQNKMKSALSDVTSANAGEYAPNVYNDVLDKIYENIRKIKKQGGPIVNQRGFMDGAPPKGSNWRIMGDGKGTSITMDLPNMPDEILVVPDGDFDKAKVMKQGQEEYFMGADFVDEYLLGQGGTTGPKIAVRDYPTMKKGGAYYDDGRDAWVYPDGTVGPNGPYKKKLGGLTANKAREILHHGQVHGHKLTDKQRRFFGAMSKGHTNKFQTGGGYGVFGYAPHMQIGGNALAMLRDYGAGISVPRLY